MTQMHAQAKDTDRAKDTNLRVTELKTLTSWLHVWTLGGICLEQVTLTPMHAQIKDTDL